MKPANIRQSDLYAAFMRSINWRVDEIDGVYAFSKKIPLVPTVIKIQRPVKLPDENKLKVLMQKYKTKSIYIEPSTSCKLPTANYQLTNDPYIHTKTIAVDLKSPENKIFARFTEAKRRAVRRAHTLGIKVEINDDIDAFIKLKNSTTGFFLGFLTTREVTRPLWKTFAPAHAKVVLGKLNNEAVAGILMLHFNKVAYYWMAAANKRGKKNFAPTLLVWEAFKFAKKQKCTLFDFEGVFDERYPKRAREWKGFSKFKEGFGGTPVYYPQPFKIIR